MNLQEIKKQLTVNNDSQLETTIEVKKLSSLMEKQFLEQKRQRLDNLEALREMKKGDGGDITNITNNTAGGGGSGSGFDLPGLLSRFALPALAALGAELAGLDDFFKGLGLIPKLDNLKNFLKRLGDFFDKLKKIKLPDIPKLPKIQFEGGRMPRIRLPEFDMPKVRFLDKLGNKIGDFIDYKVKLPVLRFIDGLGKKIGDFLDYKIKLPILEFRDSLGKRIAKAADGIPRINLKMPELPKFQFITKAGDFVKGIEVEMPKLPKVTIGEGATDYVKGLKNILGVVGDGAGLAGKGILGFFKLAFDLLEPILEPIKFVARTIMRPFTQILLSIIDFVQGFYEGFTTEEGPMKDKLLAGLEGGFLGIVKGVTEGFDLIFLELPAMMLDYLGAEDTANFLRGLKITDLVDPIWAGIKGLVVFVGDQFMNLKDIIVGSFTLEMTRIINGVKKAFTNLSTFVNNLGDELYLLIAKNFRFKLPEVKIPETFLTPEFTLIPPINVGVGDAASISAAENRIAANKSARDAKIRGLDTEVAEMMKAQQDRLDELRESFQRNVVNAVNASTTNNNSSTTVLNNNQMPDSVAADPIFN